MEPATSGQHVGPDAILCGSRGHERADKVAHVQQPNLLAIAHHAVMFGRITARYGHQFFKVVFMVNLA